MGTLSSEIVVDYEKNWKFEPLEVLVEYTTGTSLTNKSIKVTGPVYNDYGSTISTRQLTVEPIFTHEGTPFAKLAEGVRTKEEKNWIDDKYEVITSGNKVYETYYYWSKYDGSIEFYNLDLLTPGTYVCNLVFKVKEGSNLIDTSPTFKITLKIVQGPYLTMDKSTLNFEHTKNASLPPSQNVQVSSSLQWGFANNTGGNFTITNGTGTGDQEVTFSLNPVANNLAEGDYVYTATLAAQNGGITRVLTINLKVKEAVNVPFEVTPTSLQFILDTNGILPQNQNITIKGASSWTFTTIDYYDLIKNGNFLSVRPNEKAYNLSSGTHVGRITITNTATNVSKLVNFTIQIKSDIGGTINTDGWHNFTLNPDYLEFKTSFAETYLKLTVFSKVFTEFGNEIDNYEHDYHYPFINNNMVIYLGKLVHNLFYKPEGIYNNHSNILEYSYKPTEVYVRAEERRYSDNSMIRSSTSEVFKFIKGKSQFEGFSQIFVLNSMVERKQSAQLNSIVNISFASKTNEGSVKIYKNGTLIKTESKVTFKNDTIYYYNLDLSTIAGLKVGDVIRLRCMNGVDSYENYFIDYVIIPTQTEEVFRIYFRNQNGVIVPYEFKGGIDLNSNYQFSTFEEFKNFYNQTNNVGVEHSRSIKLNTGYILKDEYRILHEIINSDLVFLEYKYVYYSITPVTKKLPNYSTEKTLFEYTLEFKLNLRHENHFLP